MASNTPMSGDALFRAVIDSAPDGIVLINQLGRIILVNAQTEKLFGYERSELLHQPIEMLVPERLRGRHRGHRAGYMSSLQVRPMGAGAELFGLRKDGSEFPIEISLSPVKVEGESLVCSAIRDITERKHVEDKIRGLLDSAPDAMVVANAEGHIVLVNTQTEKLFGYKREELLGQPVEVLVPERFWKQHRSHRTGYAAHPQSRPMGAGLELFGVRKDGTEFPVEISLSPQSTQEGAIISSTIRDVTDRKRIEDALRQSEANFRSIIEGAYGVYRAKLDGTLLAANQALATILGYGSVAHVMRLNLAADVFEPGEYLPQLLEQPGQLKQIARIAATWRRSDNKKVSVEISARPVHNADGNLLYVEGVVEDVSQRRGLEQRLRHLQKMEAIGRLAGGIAHDFNNVLNVITGYCELLLEQQQEDEKLQDSTKQILNAAQRGANLTRQLLAFSRQQVLQPQVIDLAENLRGIEKMLRRVIGEDVELSVSVGSQKLNVLTDPGQLEQIWMNLVVNARDAMPEGGKLLLELQSADLDADYCERNPECLPGHYAMLAFTDTGIGMPPEVLSRLFEPFFTTKEPGKGTGLGLATVYGIVKQSGGHITVYSEVSKGTTFKVYLPITTESVSLNNHSVVERESLSGTETILLVEDEDSLRQLTRTFLQGRGYTVLLAASSDAARAVSEAHAGKIDLLLTDVVLPGISGVTLAEQLALTRPYMKVLFVSGYTGDAISHHGLHNSSLIFLSKPYGMIALARKVRDVLESTNGNALGASL
jgi:hypothetical protein